MAMANPKRRRRGLPPGTPHYVFTDKDAGTHIDGAFGDEHAADRMVELLFLVASETNDRALAVKADGLVTELENMGPETEEDDWVDMEDWGPDALQHLAEWFDDATEVLQSVTAPGLEWEWEAGELILVINR